MSKTPLLSNSSDDEDSDHELEKRICCSFFYRKPPNNKDMSFTKKEIKHFNESANNYNLAIFTEKEMNPDATAEYCLTLYFLANFSIVQGNSRDGRKYVQQGLQVAKKLPRKQDLYFLLLASPLARVFYMEDDIDGLSSQLDDCFQMIDALGGRVPGSVLGWLRYMRARSYKNDRFAAIASYKLAIDAFELSDTIDKDFGVAHTLCRLIICILGCGEKADTIDEIVTPFPEEMRKVKNHFKHLEDMEIVKQNLVIRIIYLMAASDYNFRTRRISLTLERAKEAHELAVKSKCKEFLDVTKQRLDVYTNKLNGGANDEEGGQNQEQEQDGQGQRQGEQGEQEQGEQEQKEQEEQEQGEQEQKEQEQRENKMVNQRQTLDVSHSKCNHYHFGNVEKLNLAMGDNNTQAIN